MPDLPKKGSNARKVYDAIAQSHKGLTAFEIERNIGHIKNQHTRILELAQQGLIETTEKREEKGVKNEVWRVKNVKAQAQKKRLRPGVIDRQKLDPYECPACGATIGLLLIENRFGGGCVEVNLKPRIVIFAGPWMTFEYTNPDTEEREEIHVPEEPLPVFEEWSGKLVVGRAATESEIDEYKDKNKISKPWTIGWESHLTTCKRWGRWLNGKADEKRRTWAIKWDPEKKRFGFKRREVVAKPSVMKDAFTDELPKEVVDASVGKD